MFLSVEILIQFWSQYALLKKFLSLYCLDEQQQKGTVKKAQDDYHWHLCGSVESCVAIKFQSVACTAERVFTTPLSCPLKICIVLHKQNCLLHVFILIILNLC